MIRPFSDPFDPFLTLSGSKIKVSLSVVMFYTVGCPLQRLLQIFTAWPFLAPRDPLWPLLTFCWPEILIKYIHLIYCSMSMEELIANIHNSTISDPLWPPFDSFWPSCLCCYVWNEMNTQMCRLKLIIREVHLCLQVHHLLIIYQLKLKPVNMLL